MSSGLWHNRATITATTICTLLALPYEPTIALCVAIGGLSGILLTPDLDQPTLNRVENQLIKNKSLLLRLVGYVYVTFFSAYAYMFGHRSFWTHWPIVGTVGRLLYIAIVFGIIRLLATPIDYAIILWQSGMINWQYIIYGFIMLTIVDTIHWVMDFVVQFK